MIRISNIKLSLDQAITKEKEMINIRKLIINKYKIDSKHLNNIQLFKKAIDARKKENIHFVYTVDFQVENQERYLKNKDIILTPNLEYEEVVHGDVALSSRPIIVGFGPSGVFAALILAKNGFKPIVLERGLDVDARSKQWDDFLATKTFQESASILFGEGGAGTFSDGKLTTSVKDKRCRYVLKELIEAGAQEEILYMSKPHIGTDILKKVMKNIRAKITNLGGEIRFSSCVTDWVVENQKLSAVIVNNRERIETGICMLGIGHSARDTFKVLLNKGINIVQKPFSIGVRIEHEQEMINKSQYGKFYNHKALGAAEYKLSYKARNGRSAYTFCMCPGGYVMNSTSEPNMVVTNGMSYSNRDGKNANSALLVNVTPADYPSDHPLAGVVYQQNFEKIAYELAGSNFNCPVQLVGDFLNDKCSSQIGDITPTIEPGYSFVKMQDIYPKYITDTMKEALLHFDNKLRGFAYKNAVLTGPETRSSSPIRIVRDEHYESNVSGIYPIGEGPGYAGGIMSAAVDGIKAAEVIISKYSSKEI